MKKKALVLACLHALLLHSCGGEELSPEGQVRALIARAETAAEAKDIGAIKELIAEEYSDNGGNDRRALLGIIQYHFLRNEALHLLVRVNSIDFSDGDSARVTAVAAMAGEPIPTAASLGSLRADIYRFDVVLAVGEGGSFLLRRASWQRASVSDLL